MQFIFRIEELGYIQIWYTAMQNLQFQNQTQYDII